MMHYSAIQGCENTMPNLSIFSHFPEVKWEISVYFSKDKFFIAQAKKSIQIMECIYIYIIFLFLEENMLWVQLLISSASLRLF